MAVLFFGVVLVVAALSLFRTGKLTADRMMLQNAADSMAYSVSVVEARDLNFAAYTNRAIIANEVAIGQAIGMASWAYHWESIGNFLLEYNKYLTGPTLGISNSILPPMATAFTVPANVAFKPLMRGYAKAMTAVNHNVNKGYGIAQQIYHLASVVNTIGLLDESLKANAPDDAQMSPYGVLMLLAHLGTYGGLPIPVSETFTTSYNPAAPAVPKADWQADTAGETDAGGYGRLSAMIHNSGDPFTKGWHNPPYHTDENLTGRGWIINFFELLGDAGIIPTLTLGPLNFGIFSFGGTAGVFPGGWLGFEVDASVDFGVIGGDINFYVQLRMRMLREGGSELRAVIPIAGSDRDKVAGELFSWSSADSTNFDLGFRGGGSLSPWVRIPFVGKVELGSLGLSMSVADERLFMGVSFSGSGTGCSEPEDPDEDPECGSVDEDADIVIYDGSFPTSAPLGAAFVHAGRSTGVKKNALTSAPQHMGTDVELGLPFPTPSGPIPGDAYGKAASRLIGWYYPPSPPAYGAYFQPTLPDRNLTQGYKGLPRYIDTTGAEPLFKSGGPFLIVGLQLSQDDFGNSLYDDHSDQEPAGRFDLDEDFGQFDEMTVIAKSEVQFKRPLDIAYFARGDGYEEHGSAFNPYWQAALIETSHADRVMSVLLQNGEVAQGGIAFGANLDTLGAWLDSIMP